MSTKITISRNGEIEVRSAENYESAREIANQVIQEAELQFGETDGYSISDSQSKFVGAGEYEGRFIFRWYEIEDEQEAERYDPETLLDQWGNVEEVSVRIEEGA